MIIVPAHRISVGDHWVADGTIVRALERPKLTRDDAEVVIRVLTDNGFAGNVMYLRHAPIEVMTASEADEERRQLPHSI